MISIRDGVKKDLPRVLELVHELAVYERASHEVINTVEQMEKDGFGDDPVYGFFVAERDGIIIGIALYYWRYSTWKGKRLWLEDLIVTEKERGSGVGRLLLNRTLQKALDDNCTGIMWQVLEWNEPAINFYKKFGARLDDEWTNVHLERDQIKAWLSSDTNK